MWITKDGWVIAYYTKTEPTSRLMHWPAYTGTGITSTTLREILLAVGKAIEIDTSVVDAELRYYHWQHPEATRLLVVAGEGTIKYRFPETLTVYEGSWSFSANRVGPYDHGFSVNGRRVGSWGGGTYIHVGRLPSNALSPDNDHAGTASAPGWGQGSIAAAIAFVYR